MHSYIVSSAIAQVEKEREKYYALRYQMHT